MTRGKYLEFLPRALVDESDDLAVVILQKSGRLGLADDPREIRFLLNILKHLDQCVGDGHTGEALLTAVSAWLGMATKTGQQGEVEGKLIHQPVDVFATVASKHLDELRLFGTSFHAVRSEDLDGILHTVGLLRFRLGAIDT